MLGPRIVYNINKKGNNDGPGKRLASSSQIAFPLSAVSKSRTLRNSHVRVSLAAYIFHPLAQSVDVQEIVQPPAADGDTVRSSLWVNSNSKWTKSGGKKKPNKKGWGFFLLRSSCCDRKLKDRTYNPAATGFWVSYINIYLVWPTSSNRVQQHWCSIYA